MRVIIFIFILALPPSMFAQKRPTVKVRAGDNIMDVMPLSEIFLYPDFTMGRVFLRDGSKTEARLNYNRLVDEMHFVGPKGDTLALDKEETIKYVVISTDTFYYDRGYLKLLSTGSMVKLGMQQIWKISDTRQVGAYNSTNNSTGLLSYVSISEGGRLYDLTVNEDIILTKMERYYFGDNFNRFVPADKSNLLALFPKEQSSISNYLRENKVNFNNRNHLENLIQFIEYKEMLSQ